MIFSFVEFSFSSSISSFVKTSKSLKIFFNSSFCEKSSIFSIANFPFAIGVLSSCPISLKSSSLVLIRFSKFDAILLKEFASIPISSFDLISIRLDRSPFAKFVSCFVMIFKGERSFKIYKNIKIKTKMSTNTKIFNINLSVIFSSSAVFKIYSSSKYLIFIINSSPKVSCKITIYPKVRVFSYKIL